MCVVKVRGGPNADLRLVLRFIALIEVHSAQGNDVWLYFTPFADGCSSIRW